MVAWSPVVASSISQTLSWYASRAAAATSTASRDLPHRSLTRRPFQYYTIGALIMTSITVGAQGDTGGDSTKKGLSALSYCDPDDAGYCAGSAPLPRQSHKTPPDRDGAERAPCIQGRLPCRVEPPLCVRRFFQAGWRAGATRRALCGLSALHGTVSGRGTDSSESRMATAGRFVSAARVGGHTAL